MDNSNPAHQSSDSSQTLSFPLCFPFGIIFDLNGYTDKEKESGKIDTIMKNCQLHLDKALSTSQKPEERARVKHSKNGRYISVKIERTVISQQEIDTGYKALRSAAKDASMPAIAQIF